MTLEAERKISSKTITETTRAEEALAATKDRLAHELAGLSRLHEMSLRLLGQDNMEGLLDEFLNAAVELMRSDMGNIQVLDKDSNLKIVAHCGFKQPFLNFFSCVSPIIAASCGEAKAAKKRVIVRDITTSPIFVGTASLKIMLEAGVRACQSTPLVNCSGELMGMISTHYQEPHAPDESDLRFLDLLARQAADLIGQLKQKQELDLYSKNLETLVKERTCELERAVENERRTRREALLLQDILTHDIRNYNQVTRLSAELLAEELKGNEQVEDIVRRQLESLEGMSELLERARKLGKVVSETDPRLHPVDLVSTIRNAMNLVEKSSTVKRVDHKLKIVPARPKDALAGECLPFVLADYFLSDVFLNLYSNSLKYSDCNHNGSELFIETKVEVQEEPASSAEKSLMKEPYWVKVSVSDRGKGIPDDIKQKVFSRFLNGAKGSGLGMSIVHAIVVDRYKGRIEVKDRVPGDHRKGTLVEVFLQKA